MGKFLYEAQTGVTPGMFYNVDITEFITSDEWKEANGVDVDQMYHEYLIQRPGSRLVYNKTINFEQMQKALASEVGSGRKMPSRITSNASKNVIQQENESVKNSLRSDTEINDASGVAVDKDTESVSPILFSERTWTASEYVRERDKTAKDIAQKIGVSVKKAKAYIDSINSIAKMIADDRSRLDYFSSPGRSSFVGNVEYGGSFDFSTLCKKRRLLTGTFTAILSCGVPATVPQSPALR